ncbi:hypothetical protein ACFYUD_11045 [Nocardia tengchongensis]|uniref:DUF7373 family lipoprotein n=1 Tax=Nocardia tengchongensis TaxID=2055889 RepID=UPI00367AEDED
MAISILASAGCGSESGAATEKSVDVSKFDTGSYPTKPQDPTTTDPAKRARLIEGLRLGDVLPVASDIDSTLVRNASSTNVFVEPYDFDDMINVDHFADDAPGFTVGFATSGRPAKDPFLGYTLTNAVMIFDSEPAAATAAAALVRRGFWMADKGAQVEPVQSTQHAGAQMIWAPTEQRFASWYPTGRFVIFTMVDQIENRVVEHDLGVPPEPAPLALTDKAIDITLDRLKTFQPTPSDKLTALPLDPDGMVRLVLPRPAGDQTANGFTGSLDHHGALHTVGDTAMYRALFDKTGVDSFGYGGGILVRTKDETAAQYFQDTAFVSRFQHQIAPPAGLPSARCTKYHGPDEHAAPFTCTVSFGRYVATVVSQQQQDAYQRISAQYAILANSK